MNVTNLFFSVGLKSISIVFKFFFTTYLISKLSLSDYGYFSYYSMISGFLVFIYGLDFYNYIQYSLSKKKRDYDVINEHCSVIFYVFMLAFLFCILSYFLDVQSIIILVVFVGFSEYLLTEVYRYLVYFEKSKLSNFLLFIKTCSWPLFVIFSFFIFDEIDVSQILLIWLINNVAIIFLIGFHSFENEVLPKVKILKPKFIMNGLLFSFPYLISTLSYKLLEFLDRFYIGSKMNSDMLGIFSTYMSFVGVIQTFIYVGVSAEFYPKLLKSETKHEFMKVSGLMFSAILFSVLFLSAPIFGFFNYYSIFVGKPELTSNSSVFFILLVSNAFFCLSLVFHYMLLKFGLNRFVLISTLVSLCLSLLLYILFRPENLISVSYIGLFSTTTLFILKGWFAYYGKSKFLFK